MEDTNLHPSLLLPAQFQGLDTHLHQISQSQEFDTHSLEGSQFDDFAFNPTSSQFSTHPHSSQLHRFAVNSQQTLNQLNQDQELRSPTSWKGTDANQMPGSDQSNEIVNFADTTGSSRPLPLPTPPVDMLLHCGNLAQVGWVSSLKRALEILRSMDIELKLVIAGTHDLELDQ